MISLKTLAILFLPSLALGRIDREWIASRYNVVRTSLIDNGTTSLQVGNGNFAFSLDNTGMQTFLPFNTLSSWAWHNDSLPINGEELGDYHGVSMDTHG
ncbi:Fc.00g027460.m01.CDS01 [Cosmosporella sp. VM-42]